MNSLIRRTSGFTLVELIVGMTIFAIGLTAILGLLHTTIQNSWYSRHEIVVANLLREQIELVKNLRDTNVRNFLPFDAAKLDNGPITPFGTGFASGVYIIENNFAQSGITFISHIDYPITIKKLDSIVFLAGDSSVKWEQSRLSLDSQERFTHTTTSTGTAYASYMIVTPLQFPLSTAPT
jgi:prepilin-type N-terminal cleavage/methylation domain-containing protein